MCEHIDPMVTLRAALVALFIARERTGEYGMMELDDIMERGRRGDFGAEVQAYMAEMTPLDRLVGFKLWRIAVARTKAYQDVRDLDTRGGAA